MGSQLWYHEASWISDPATALTIMHGEMLEDITSRLMQAKGLARGSTKLTDMDVEKLRSQMRSGDSLLLVQAARDALKANQGLKYIGDIQSVSSKRQPMAAHRISSEEITRLFGVPRPTREQALSGIAAIVNELKRAECICFPIYQDDRPIAWLFVGVSMD